jgi:hypothetical protein
MISTLQIYEDLCQTLDERAAKMIAHHLAAVYEDLQQTATKADVADLRAVVQELAEAQKRTDQRLDTLTQRVAELAEAQKRTDQRVAELAEAQKRTDQRVAELAEAQKRTDQRVAELAEAQTRTEQAVRQLAVRLDDTNAQLGGLAATVGYTLENEAYRHLPALLKRDHSITVSGRLIRDFRTDRRGRDIEINILGTGERDGGKVLIVGESKAQLSHRDVDRFLKHRLATLDPGDATAFPVIVAHMVSERGTVEYARQKGVAVYLSYEFVN